MPVDNIFESLATALIGWNPALRYTSRANITIYPPYSITNNIPPRSILSIRSRWKYWERVNMTIYSPSVYSTLSGQYEHMIYNNNGTAKNATSRTLLRTKSGREIPVTGVRCKMMVACGEKRVFSDDRARKLQKSRRLHPGQVHHSTSTFGLVWDAKKSWQAQVPGLDQQPSSFLVFW